MRPASVGRVISDILSITRLFAPVASPRGSAKNSSARRYCGANHDDQACHPEQAAFAQRRIRTSRTMRCVSRTAMIVRLARFLLKGHYPFFPSGEQQSLPHFPPQQSAAILSLLHLSPQQDFAFLSRLQDFASFPLQHEAFCMRAQQDPISLPSLAFISWAQQACPSFISAPAFVQQEHCVFCVLC